MLTQAAANLSHHFSTFDLASRRSVVAAVSGGSDSTALLVLLRQFLNRNAPDTRLIAVTIDHRLRATSADEATTVAKLCARLGIEHRTLAWAGEKPKTGIPAAARAARYRLLADAAQEAGTDIVLTGHTADDQIETVAMRAQRGDGRGLAGMAPATLYGGSIWICRPLLAARREMLRDHLRGQEIGWIDDPTNIDAAYERPRMRAALSAASENGDDGIALTDIARAGQEREALGKATAELIAASAARTAADTVRLDALILSANQDTAIYALRLLLASVGGCEQLPDATRSSELLRRLRHGNDGAPRRATLSRCVIEAGKAGIRLRPETRRKAPRVVLPSTVVPYAAFLPSFDIAPATALARLLGAAEPPPPPFVQTAPFPGHD